MDGDVSEWMSKAQGHYQARRWDAAAAIYRRVLKAEPLHREAPLRLAEVLLAQGRLAEAIPVLEAATQRLPDDAEIHRALADTLHMQGDRTRAIDAYRRAVELDPTHGDAWWGLGCAWRRSKITRPRRQLSPLDRPPARSRPGLAQLREVGVLARPDRLRAGRLPQGSRGPAC